MPNIKDDSTVEAIAQAFTSNGRNKLEALKTVGYKPSYYNTLGIGRVYSNIRVKQAIARIDARTSAKAERTVTSLDAMYQRAYDQALTEHQPSAGVSAVTGIARLYGMDKDNQLHTDKPVDIDSAELEQVEAMARQALKLA
jgi:hypothetical protein